MKSINNFFIGPFDITASKDFAILSYDFNPIHIDEIYCRTTRYGRPIVHGVNVVMKVLEILAMEEIYIKNLNITFKKPVFHNEIYVVYRDDTKKELWYRKNKKY